jgi:hypothetical protein
MTTSINTSSVQAINRPSQRDAADLAATPLSDTTSDIEVVVRELSLSPSRFERMRRALDCLQGVRVVLESGANGRI